MSYFYNYMALEKPFECAQLVGSYGIQPSNNPDILANQLKDVAMANGDIVLNRLAEIHPDKELVLESNKSWSNASGCGNGYSNCGGCGGFQAVNGQSIQRDVEKLVNGNAQAKNNDLMIIGAVVIVSLALIFKGK